MITDEDLEKFYIIVEKFNRGETSALFVAGLVPQLLAEVARQREDINRDDIERLERHLAQLVREPRPAVVPFEAMEALRTNYLDRGYKAALLARIPTLNDDLYAVLIHETPNRILGALVWSERTNEWLMSEGRGPLLIMKAQLHSSDGRELR